MKNAMLIGLLLLAAACTSVSPLRRPSPALPGDMDVYSGPEEAPPPEAYQHGPQAPESVDAITSSGP